MRVCRPVSRPKEVGRAMGRPWYLARSVVLKRSAAGTPVFAGGMRLAGVHNPAVQVESPGAIRTLAEPLMRVRVLLAGVVLPAVLWALLPIGTAAAPRLSNIQHKIDVTQGLIGRKRGTERLLTTQISAYNQRIGTLQGRISTLTSRETRIEADLDRKRAELERLQSDLRFQRARLVRLRARLKVAVTAPARRMVEIYESDPPGIVTR